MYRTIVVGGGIASIVALYRMHRMDLNGIVKGSLEWLACALLRAVRLRIKMDYCVVCCDGENARGALAWPQAGNEDASGPAK